MDPACWPLLKLKLAEIFRSRTRDEWCALLEGTDACFAPVLDMDEVGAHPHNRDRDVLVTVDGVPQPGPAPRFSRTVPDAPTAAPVPGADTPAASKGTPYKLR